MNEYPQASIPHIVFLFCILLVLFPVAIELIVQHIRDFLNDRGRGLDIDASAATSSAHTSTGPGFYGTGKKRNDSMSNNLHLH